MMESAYLRESIKLRDERIAALEEQLTAALNKWTDDDKTMEIVRMREVVSSYQTDRRELFSIIDVHKTTIALLRTVAEKMVIARNVGCHGTTWDDIDDALRAAGYLGEGNER